MSKSPLADRVTCSTCGMPVYSALATLGDEVECYSCGAGEMPEEDQDE